MKNKIKHSNLPIDLLKQTPEVLPKYCDRCGNHYSETDLEQIKSESTKASFRLGCKSCGNSYIFHINTPMNGILSARRFPFKPAITTKELKKFSKSTTIDTDEVIDLYSSLKKVDTIEDFNKLFHK
ncbi:MAG: hypothetical protein Q9M91_08550 [Candidatus Dojkabacteria bacterium]|nr:hypothetical protein [Candidatus Dojkabacteria bacterium]MDQ7021822.1 hypothetical protein [Candidatus Dojkabacteria bacterium]